MQKIMPQNQLEPEQKEPQPLDLQRLKRLNQVSSQQAFRFIKAQLLTTIVLSTILLFFDDVMAYSAFTGGVIATLANAWFAIKVFRVKPTVAADTLLTTFYIGEMYKIVFTGAMFIVAFVLIKPISVVALLSTYFLIHMTPAVVNVFFSENIDPARNKEN